MAYEHSAPRNKVIYGVGALFVLMVLLLIPIGRSYFFAILHETEQRNEQLYPVTSVEDYHHEEQANLHAQDLVVDRDDKQVKLSGGVPITKALDELAKEGRLGAPAVAPKPDEDLAALKGWNARPNPDAEKTTQAAEAARGKEPAKPAGH